MLKRRAEADSIAIDDGEAASQIFNKPDYLCDVARKAYDDSTELVGPDIGEIPKSESRVSTAPRV